jgi:hypothetical protein
MKPRYMVLGGYLGIALFAWIEFLRLPPDGLANVGLFLVTFPIAFVGLAVTELLGVSSFALMPNRFGYVWDHAAYYFPAVMVTALLLYALTRRLGRAIE